MADRFPARKLIALAAALGVAACAGGGEVAEFTPDAETEAEAELRSRAEAIQSTKNEGGAVGGIAASTPGFTIGGGRSRRGSGSVNLGLFAGALAGAVVGEGQADFADEEDRLEALIAELDATNEEAEALLGSMQLVLEEQRRRLATLRAAVAEDSSAEAALRDERADAERSARIARDAIEAAEARAERLGESRGLLEEDGSRAEVDPKLQALSRRISQMRAVAEALAAEA
ncbi:MAG: hypothetical protein AAF899_12985 [Pseudomonadota bacterium]